MAYRNDNTKDFIIALNETWKLRQIKGLPPKILYKLEEDVYISFRTMLFHVLHTAKKRTDRNEAIDYLNQNAPDINFKHNIQQRYITKMFKKWPHFFINLYYYFSRIVHKKAKI